MSCRRFLPSLADHPIRLWIVVLAGLCLGSPTLAEKDGSLLVRYRSAGESAVTECAEHLWRTGGRFQDFTTDRSDSLDRWHQRHETTSVRALFREASENSMEAQARRLADRIEHYVAKRHARSMRGVRSTHDVSELRDMASKLAQIHEVRLSEGQDLDTAMTDLRTDPHVAYVQANHTHQLDFSPNDPFLSSAGSWSQSFADLWGLDRIGVGEAWETPRGRGQIVAVVDTGLDYLHPDIANNVWVNPGEDLDGNGRVDPHDWNGIDDDGNGLVDDLRGYDFTAFGETLSDGSLRKGDPDPFDEIGHGTHVAGIIAAVADNGIGSAGVAPEALVMPLKGFGSDGKGRDSDLWRAVLYAIENGADVINASWSCSPVCPCSGFGPVSP